MLFTGLLAHRFKEALRELMSDRSMRLSFLRYCCVRGTDDLLDS